MIKFIQADDVLGIRNEVLRNGKLTLNECRFPTDKTEGAFHLGYYVKGVLAGITSLHPQNYHAHEGVGYQLRGMATLVPYRGKGLGARLIGFAALFLTEQKAGYIWCNARKTAVKFYRGNGFEVISNEFDVAGIGPHYVMYRKL